MFDNLGPVTFFKVELNCKLEDVGSVVVLSLRDSLFGELHNHLVCWLLLCGVLFCFVLFCFVFFFCLS